MVSLEATILQKTIFVYDYALPVRKTDKIVVTILALNNAMLRPVKAFPINGISLIHQNSLSSIIFASAT